MQSINDEKYPFRFTLSFIIIFIHPKTCVQWKADGMNLGRDFRSAHLTSILMDSNYVRLHKIHASMKMQHNNHAFGSRVLGALVAVREYLNDLRWRVLCPLLFAEAAHQPFYFFFLALICLHLTFCHFSTQILHCNNVERLAFMLTCRSSGFLLPRSCHALHHASQPARSIIYSIMQYHFTKCGIVSKNEHLDKDDCQNVDCVGEAANEGHRNTDAKRTIIFIREWEAVHNE